MTTTADMTGAEDADSRRDADASEQPRQLPALADFLTDGSLAELCDRFTALTNIEVELRDERDRRVVRVSGEGLPWRILSEGESPRVDPHAVRVPLGTVAGPIGAMVMHAGEDGSPELEATLRVLARTAGELCDTVLELRRNFREIEVLFRLTSLLVRASAVEDVLQVALESALDVLGLDAGSIVLLPEDADDLEGASEGDLTLSASRGLSEAWLNSPLPLSRDREFDRQALKGKTVTSDDLALDPRVLVPEQVRTERLHSFVCVGLLFRRRPVGVVRLFGRTPRKFADDEIRLLRSIAEQAAVAVEQARLLVARQHERQMQRQLRLARDVQMRMLPRHAPKLPGLDVSTRYVPSLELGGDFYDVFPVGDSLGMVIGDVVGKGVAAALLMSAVRATLRAHVQDVYDIDDVITRVNQATCRDTLDNEFATLWYGTVDVATHRLTYTSAGHEPPIVFRCPDHRPPTTADVDELAICGMVVGIDPSQRYQRGIYDLKPADTLLCYTDGITDNRDFANAKFGKARMIQAVLDALGENPDATANDISEKIMWASRQFSGLATRVDDMTLVVLRVSRDGPVTTSKVDAKRS